MGLGPSVLALYCQLKRLGIFEGITDMTELALAGISGQALLGEMGKRIRRRVVG
jgi:hypothetical protein